MRSPMARTRGVTSCVAGTLLLLVLACVGCGGGSSGGGASASPSPAKTKGPQAKPSAVATPVSTPAAISVAKVGHAFDTLTAACLKRRGDVSSRTDHNLTARLRKAATIHIKAFRKNPDQAYQRAAGKPKLSMRQRLRQLSALLEHDCGGGLAKTLGRRFTALAGH